MMFENTDSAGYYDMTAKRLLLAFLPTVCGFAFTMSGPRAMAQVSAAPASIGTGTLPGLPLPRAMGSSALPGSTVATQGTGTMPFLSGGEATTMNTLTAPAGLPASPYPAGTVASPWSHGTQPECCGPTGGNGPVTYELYAKTGPSLIIGGGATFSGAAEFGWLVGGGGRTLLFNPEGDAAWVLDLGLHYAYNGGKNDRTLDVFNRPPRGPDGLLTGPDVIFPFTLRGVTRTSFNYSVGRDWFLNGPGVLGFEQNWNSRFGVDVGGRYGTIRVDLIPETDRDNYFRRYSVTNGVSLGAHYNAETPVGNWILFTGFRVEYGFNWSNVVPPLDGNFQDLNLLLTVGVRF